MVINKNIHDEVINIKKEDILFATRLLKLHTGFRNTQLINIIGLDLRSEKNRFNILYIFSSPRIYNKEKEIKSRMRIILKVQISELESIESINQYFPNRIWYEREIWDLFGIFFLNNPNLRRILNDYGFEGHPFRKDYPLTGYNQVQYDLTKKRLISTNVELRQQYR